VPRNRTEPSGFAIRYAHPAPHVIRAGEGNRTHLSCLASTCLNRSATPAWSGYSGSNRAMHSLEGWPLTKRIPASMAVPTDTAEAGAFGTAGAGFESRTRLRNVPGSVASEDEPAWWTHGVTLPIVLLARQNSDLSRLSPNVSRGAGESNAILLIWNQLGHHGLRPIALPSASYEDRTRLIPWTEELRHQSHHEALELPARVERARRRPEPILEPLPSLTFRCASHSCVASPRRT
jgi:hypothetical protein